MRTPDLPPRLARLDDLARNLWWSWHEPAGELFRGIDPMLWMRIGRNPVRLLGVLGRERLEELAVDAAFGERLDSVATRFDEARRGADTWAARTGFEATVAYFSAEFGLHGSLPLYSGGLGVLAGDHCKEASDLGLSLVGVGLMYPSGYFHQRISSSGWQEPAFETIDWEHAPIRRLRHEETPLIVAVPLDGGELYASAWEVAIGRTRLLLLDTNTDLNDPADRQISAQLYGGDRRTRLAQELLMGIGGVRLLRTLGIDPVVWHANEGHVAFMMLERLREALADGTPFDEAVERVRASTVFTTHTPVPAGHDAFPFPLLEDALRGYWGELEMHRSRFFDLGRHAEHWGEGLNMTVLSIRLSAHRNGVSRLHGKVSRRMWHHLWPGREEEDVPIRAITNGVHVPTWVSPSMAHLFGRHLGADWIERQDDDSLWERVREIPDGELWEAHQQQKDALLHTIRERLRDRWRRALEEPSHLVASGLLLDPHALTIGFARRFATYKRASLVFRDLERLLTLLDDPRRPLQFVFAGKAHPADDPGKQLIQKICEHALDRRFAGRIAFVADYDLSVSKELVSGVDVWLNNPRPPLEACGTSGQKASLNGVPHFSVLDGWWAEGYRGSNGWAIGPAREHETENDDEVDADDLYRILAGDILPLYYDRDGSGVPVRWVERMKDAIATCAGRFSARRMVKEYVEHLYVPAANGTVPGP